LARYYYIATMGCQMNENDSNHLGQLLMRSSFVPTGDPKEADLILINTCAVRAKAEQKAFSLLGRMIALKKTRPHVILGLMGCIAQQDGPDLLQRFPALDLVLGTREIGRILEALGRIENEGERVVATDLDLEPAPCLEVGGYHPGRIKSFISIMVGCNNFCSYCIVPYVRGREVSRLPGEIFKEADLLVSQGVKEITLLGQNVNSYCSGPDGSFRFPDLLRRLNRLDGLERIRFTTSHPKDLSGELIHCFADLDNLCPHIHLPFQAGSNRVLERMNRGYTREDYMSLAANLRRVRPGMAVTSDVMVGFPGETEQDFQLTLDLMREIGFDNLFSFKYSDRRGTAAEKMEGKIDEKEKSARLAALQTLQKGITLEKNKALEGKEMEVLVEGHSKKGSQLTGRTGTNKIVNLTGNPGIIGSIVKVTIELSFPNSLRGKLT
jgi:tRNA-2-methylthio-N6-dimethylallyladenosine synthase